MKLHVMPDTWRALPGPSSLSDTIYFYGAMPLQVWHMESSPVRLRVSALERSMLQNPTSCTNNAERCNALHYLCSGPRSWRCSCIELDRCDASSSITSQNSTCVRSLKHQELCNTQEIIVHRMNL
jgi:hypothetical protein